MKLYLARGCRDIAAQEKQIKNKVVNTITKAFECYGFAPLETPIIERYETLAAKSGAGAESDVLKETFKLSDQGGRKLALRFELTTSLARYLALNPTTKLPYKRYEIGPNFRDGPIKKGRERQFWQADADTVGSASIMCEAEQLALMHQVLSDLKFDFTITVNNRKVLNGILRQSGVKNIGQAMIALDKLNKIGKEGVRKELTQHGYTKTQCDAIFKLLNPDLKEIKKDLTDEEGLQGIAELTELFKLAKEFGVTSLTFVPTLVRGQAYYTGTILEAFFTKSKSGITSSIASGGRYDNMIGGFMGNRHVPAVGISFGLTAIVAELLAGDNNLPAVAQVYVAGIGKAPWHLVAAQLRQAGIRTDMALSNKSISKQLQYANTLQIPYVAIVGEQEHAQGKVLLRDMKSGDETLMTLQSVIKKLK